MDDKIQSNRSDLSGSAGSLACLRCDICLFAKSPVRGRWREGDQVIGGSPSARPGRVKVRLVCGCGG